MGESPPAPSLSLRACVCARCPWRRAQIRGYERHQASGIKTVAATSGELPPFSSSTSIFKFATFKTTPGGKSQHLPMCVSINGRDNHSTDRNTFVHGIDLMIKSGKCQVIARFIQALSRETSAGRTQHYHCLQ